MPGMKTTQQMRDELLLKGMAGGGEVKAPVTPNGFYSPLEEAALRIQRKAGNAQAFMNDLKTVPKEHIQHAGVDRLLTSRPTITREELQQHVAQAAPKVEVKVLGQQGPVRKLEDDLYRMAEAAEGAGKTNPFVEEILSGGSSDSIVRMADRHGGPEEMVALARHINSIHREGVKPKYAKYQLPGGENYREVLLTLPEKKNAPVDSGKSAATMLFERDMMEKYGGDSFPSVYGRLNGNEIDKYEMLVREDRNSAKSESMAQDRRNNYRSNHWDEPNVLAHFRINDRTDKDGKKVLFVEEIQSDWGQEGKKKGFANPGLPAGHEVRRTTVKNPLAGLGGNAGSPVERYAVFDPSGNKLTSDFQTEDGARSAFLANSPQIPSAPFVTKTNDWVNLALKHIMKMAAQEGHDRVAFVKGEQAAERFGLDKHFSRVAARPTPTGGYELQTILKDGSREDSIDVPPNKLHEYVGEDLAKKIHGQGGGVFEGGDLKMPQMGMRKFYDELVPAQAHALVKKFGGQGIKPIQVQTGEQGAQVVPNGTGWGVVWSDGVFTPAKSREHADQLVAPYTEHPGFDITPQMRQQILKPMSYKVGGSVQQRRDELLLRGMAGGGEVSAGTDWRSKLVGGGIRGIITRGLLGMDPPEDMTPGERDIYENMVRLSAPAQGLGVGKAIFIGAKAKTWNKAAADQFLAMEKAGVRPEQIWRETGTFRSADGKLRQEISDVGALHRNPAQLQELGKAKKEEARELQLRMVTPIGQKDLFPKALTEAKKPAREQVARLKAEADELMRPADVRGQSARFVLEHPELYKAYPELANIPVMQGVSGSGRGSLIGGGSDLQMAITQQGLRFDPRSTTLHEMQHAVQHLEDMAPGGSPAMAFLNPKAHEILQQLRAKASTPMSFEQFVEQYGTNANNAARYQEYLKGIPQTVAGMDRQLQHTAAMQYYNRLAGEAEARATQFRERMGPTRRAQEFPYSSYDVLPEDLIVNPPHSSGYAKGGAVPAMDAMRLQVWDKKIHKKDGGSVEDDYRGEHAAPGPTSGKPMHDLTDVYPEDFYGPNGFRYYADMGNDYDRKSYVTTRVARGNPNQTVWIHRAIPKNVYKKAMQSTNPLQQMIRPGDWVTISKEYAKEHGESALKGDYKIASKIVRASDIYTNGDSIHEWGYHPGQRSDKE